MTPGQSALAEAARLESARVYGTVIREHKQPRQRADENADIAAAIRAGDATSTIIERFAVDYATVRAVRKRVMAKGAA